jgi:DNA-directed RNA polymerase
LPIALDASANGLQHFALLRRDPVVARLVNLTPGERPVDIYLEVANFVSELVEKDAEIGNKIAQQWVGKIDRKIVKRPVMTFPYGAKQYTYKEQILEELFSRIADGSNDFKTKDIEPASRYLAKKIDECIGSLLEKPVETMKWLQEITRITVKKGSPVTWTTPSGLKVHQEYRKTDIKKIDTYWGDINLRLESDDDTCRFDLRAMINGISPNFIHSLDASHLILTVIKCVQNGICDFSLVHDSHGCHACDTDILRECLKETFIEMYSNDLLKKFRTDITFNSNCYINGINEN